MTRAGAEEEAAAGREAREARLLLEEIVVVSHLPQMMGDRRMPNELFFSFDKPAAEAALASHLTALATDAEELSRDLLARASSLLVLDGSNKGAGENESSHSTTTALLHRRIRRKLKRSRGEQGGEGVEEGSMRRADV